MHWLKHSVARVNRCSDYVRKSGPSPVPWSCFSSTFSTNESSFSSCQILCFLPLSLLIFPSVRRQTIISSIISTFSQRNTYYVLSAVTLEMHTKNIGCGVINLGKRIVPIVGRLEANSQSLNSDVLRVLCRRWATQ